MFVAIDNIDMDVFKVEEWIKTNRDANGGVISPEFAMEILGKTNHFAHIKKVINNIKKACLDENGELVADKVLAYREFILSCVDRREMSPQAMAVLQELAETGGFKDEFDKVKDEPKCYFKNDCYKVVVVKSKEEFKALEGENLSVFFDAENINLEWINLRKVKSLRFREGAEVNLYEAYNLPKDLDLSMCSKVELRGCDLSKVKALKFKEGTKVDLRWIYILPEFLDVSMCSKVDLGRNLKGVIVIKFKDKEQKKKFMKGVEYFRGRVVYADEDKKEKEDNSLFSRIKKRFGSGGMGE